MKTYYFVVDGEPVAKARPRLTARGHIYTPPKTLKHERAIKEKFYAEYGKDFTPTDKAISVRVFFFLKKPARVPADFPPRPLKRPDIDNLIKTVLDALNGVLYQDDKQIVKILGVKKWSDEGDGFTCVFISEEE